ncbi:MAG TPA: bifunctional adenosylcobinamide kinase/adenosylcobinamide-phosphate guanylyltransferase [Candidatus Dormibacteraeota bacterium]|nr:bifunctional adenosylcobinamide kinase/adenosylcobinamide-phosphate guanylyltransferase [Candidatus Dormibacteraeota bacterium]
MGYVLLLGGARSGKSDLAQRLAVESALPVTFIATATGGDEEMADRIRRHRVSRPAEWSTVEEPVDLRGAVLAAPRDHFVVVDCLTLWVSNLLGSGSTPEEISLQAQSCASELAGRRGVVVTNEVGLGIVPTNQLARTFRDVLGSVNAVFSRCAERSLLMVAGRTLDLR